MPESTIQVAVPSYPAEFGNEAYRIAESMEASAAGDATLGPPHEAAAPAGDYYNAADAQQPVQPQPHASRWNTDEDCLPGWPFSKSYFRTAHLMALQARCSSCLNVCAVDCAHYAKGHSLKFCWLDPAALRAAADCVKSCQTCTAVACMAVGHSPSSRSRICCSKHWQMKWPKLHADLVIMSAMAPKSSISR